LVTAFDLERVTLSLTLAAELRRAGLNVTSYTEPDKLPKQFKYADKIGARIVLVLGPDEVLAGEVTLKDLRSGKQQTIRREAVVEICRQILEAPIA
jgi:histidyl-tRNA synthetase